MAMPGPYAAGLPRAVRALQVVPPLAPTEKETDVFRTIVVGYDASAGSGPALDLAA
jgi:hypothetical protein